MNFTIAVIDDTKINGTHAATIAAHVANWTDGTATVNVLDNESTNLVLSPPFNVTEGGTFNMVVTLQPGRCYTIIAMSAPLQVSTVEVKLLAPPLFNIEAGRSGAGDKNPAVLGKGKGATCPISPIAVPYRVDVVARKGAGRVGVALFSKAK